MDILNLIAWIILFVSVLAIVVFIIGLIIKEPLILIFLIGLVVFYWAIIRIVMHG